MLFLYVLGFLAAIATAKLLKSSVLKSAAVPFVLELPEYRQPDLAFDRSPPARPLKGLPAAGGNGHPGSFFTGLGPDASSTGPWPFSRTGTQRDRLPRTWN